MGIEGVTDSWQIHEHDVSERTLRIVGDTDGSGIAIDSQPLMVFAVTKVFRNVRHSVFC